MAKVGLIVGSLRKGAFTRLMAHALPELAPPSLQFFDIDIGDLPLYNEDLESSPPAQWTRFRQQVVSADGILFVTPEHNRSIPGALKNALDVGSRPWGRSAWGWQACGSDQPEPRRTRRYGCRTSFAAGDVGRESRGHASSGSLHSCGRRTIRRHRSTTESTDARVHDELLAGIRDLAAAVSLNRLFSFIQC